MRLEHAELRALLPHRYPMLLLDRVEAVEPGVSLEAVKTVTGCEPCYRGIAEGEPADRYAYPASLLIESFGQGAAVLWLLSRRPGTAGLPMFTAARECVLLRPAYPGDVIRHRVRLDQVVDGAAFASGSSWIGDDKVAEFGSMMAVVRPVDAIARAS
ncbi:3-hydroxyacyl-ACP dehydratase FabZ family protein [Micromonospora globbae]|jgi:3-hydroxyacyl-[acyl-carrier-protein] dehydratase|uniref:Beta-hydroxyacyl-ACP dehydratase n=1 Tax=Micromonospora globbae TaxID=1894969 RepID=A0A420EW10_9ACTN|nr:beta-hydroxyacyl-ACP dehydratase [Micromonospora globbae]RKF24873.1 beta-hydroxyacyl-ACP dehydratase [Micromonospora globbae]WTF83639.1 beta-hydroxyacyl-ACP dehydratase [Micromonospora globbae]